MSKLAAVTTQVQFTVIGRTVIKDLQKCYGRVGITEMMRWGRLFLVHLYSDLQKRPRCLSIFFSTKANYSGFGLWSVMYPCCSLPRETGSSSYSMFRISRWHGSLQWRHQQQRHMLIYSRTLACATHLQLTNANCEAFVSVQRRNVVYTSEQTPPRAPTLYAAYIAPCTHNFSIHVQTLPTSSTIIHWLLHCTSTTA